MTGSGTFTARVAAPGIALGSLHRTDRPRMIGPAETAAETRTETGVETGAEIGAEIGAAFDAVAERLSALADRLHAEGRPEEAEITEVGGLIARDADLRTEAQRRAKDGLPADLAVEQAVAFYADTIAALGDPALAERATDVRQVGTRAVAWLRGDRDRSNGRTDERGMAGAAGDPVVLIAREIGAVDLLESRAPVAAALSVAGGPNSHAAIVARSLGIPLLIGIDRALLDLPDGTQILVDAEHPGEPAVVRPAPPRRDRDAAEARMAEAARLRETYAAERSLPCRTLDGHAVTLRANAATAADVRAGLAAGAEGIGLLRTELPFLEAAGWPTEAQHVAALSPMLRQMAGRPIVARTLDFADDKLPPFLLPGGQGAAAQGRIGRGLPLMLAEPAAFGAQFRALLRAAPDGDGSAGGPDGGGLSIMIPMVADVAELRACRRLLDEAAASLGVPAPPLGVMIELPEAVEAAGDLAAEAAFLSIGSNDLTCQVLGLDRRDPAATPLMTAHPRVLTAIRDVISAAHRHGRPVSVCGDAAAHPAVMPLLVGLGVDALSVAPGAVDEIRYQLRRLAYADCRRTAEQALHGMTGRGRLGTGL